jgi:uncharacterized membrane protein
MSLADEVRTVRERVSARLAELEPLVREYDELLKLADELGIDIPERKRSRSTVAAVTADAVAGAGTKPTSDDSPAPAPTRGSRQGTSATRTKSGRPRRRRTAAEEDGETGPERDARVIEKLRASPGSTIAELATMLGVPPTSLYRAVRELTTSGAVVKRGRGLFVEG